MSAQTNLLSFSTTWFVTFSVFLMNVQLGRNYAEHDVVDHAVAIAADTASKTYCDGSPDAAEAAVQPLLKMVGAGGGSGGTSDGSTCHVITTERGVGTESGARDLDVLVRCRFRCSIPIASQAMCSDGFVTFERHRQTVAMGCDAK